MSLLHLFNNNINFIYIGLNPELIYSSLRQIKVFNLKLLHTSILIDDLQHVTGLAVDRLTVYWTLYLDGNSAIVRANKSEPNPEIIVDSGKYVKLQYNFFN